MESIEECIRKCDTKVNEACRQYANRAYATPLTKVILQKLGWVSDRQAEIEAIQRVMPRLNGLVSAYQSALREVPSELLKNEYFRNLSDERYELWHSYKSREFMLRHLTGDIIVCFGGSDEKRHEFYSNYQEKINNEFRIVAKRAKLGNDFLRHAEL